MTFPIPYAVPLHVAKVEQDPGPRHGYLRYTSYTFDGFEGGPVTMRLTGYLPLDSWLMLVRAGGPATSDVVFIAPEKTRADLLARARTMGVVGVVYE